MPTRRSEGLALQREAPRVENFYNYHRPHGAQAGQTPYERLSPDPPIRVVGKWFWGFAAGCWGLGVALLAGATRSSRVESRARAVVGVIGPRSVAW
jgi:hypothetical protein